LDILVFSAIGTLIGFLILYSVIVMAVRNALAQHYKVVRWYEATGEWLPRAGGVKEAPRAFVKPPAKPLP
jgi:hypothetical protein